MSNHIDMGRLYFEEGIPGFPHLRFFQLVQDEVDSPIFSMYSIEDSLIRFWLVDPFVFYKDYEFALKDHYKEMLKITEETQLIVLNIATARSNQVTVNLKAPIVINFDNKMAKQIILEDDRYNLRQPLLQAQENQTSE